MAKKFKHDFTLDGCLFGAGKLTKHSNQYGYNVYDIGFGACSEFLLLGGGACKNDFIFGVDSSSPRHIDTVKKDI